MSEQQPAKVQPVTGRTHTDMYRSPKRIRNLFGKNGINLTWLSADGVPVSRLIAFAVVAVVWSLPMWKVFHVSPLGMGMLVVLGPPALAAWLIDMRMPDHKTFLQWVASIARASKEKPTIVGGFADDLPDRVVVRSIVWSPNKDGLN